MKKIIKSFAGVVTAVFLAVIPVSCGDSSGTNSDFSFYNENLTSNSDYNGNLFYLNSLDFEVADPSVIYITKGVEKGYFYAYGTSDNIGCHGFQSWRSKDLSHWESMGVAFMPDYANTWATTNYWAPEVVYDNEDGLYYMFYNAQNLNDNNYQYISVAYSSDPAGPFVVANNRRDSNGDMLLSTKPVVDLTPDNSKIDSLTVRRQAIDASPFIDPVTGDRYLYFSYYDSFDQSEIFGMKMTDWFTPDYSTLKQLTAVGWLSVKAKQNSDITKKTAEGTINEGPFMLYDNGIYYLTFSVYGYTSENYQVRQALGTSPLGTFNKVAVEDGGAVVATDSNWSDVTSSGHHSFVRCGDEIFIAYHTFKNRTDISSGRALAVDRVEFVQNSKGQKVLHTDGPTYSLQALPELVSGYKDIAGSAQISSDNTAAGSDVKYLNDNIIKLKNYDLATEYETKSGTADITLSWSEYKTARAIMVYNSYDYEKSFVEIKNIKIYYKGSDGKQHVAETGKIKYDFDFYSSVSEEVMNPGGSAVVEFDDLPINKIEITIVSPSDSEGVCLSEISVLGKDAEFESADSFKKYSYTNPEYSSSEIINESAEFGTVKGTNLKTMFGYNLIYDDRTENAYITQKGCYDQYCYFKDIYSTKYYIEAEFTVTEIKAYANDPYPKFGIITSCPENTIYFYIDAVNFNNDWVGCAQRKLDNSDWNWKATEQLVEAKGIKYSNGNYVKMAMLRDGTDFSFYINDKLVISYNSFSVFVSNKQAGVGFLSFNTGLKIKNYSATQDGAAVDNKSAELNK